MNEQLIQKWKVLVSKMMLKSTTVTNFKVFAIYEKCKKLIQNGTQKLMKLTKNATKINEKVEGRRGKGKKGNGKERKGEDRRGEGRKGEERRPTGRSGAAPAGQRQLGGGLINLKGGDTVEAPPKRGPFRDPLWCPSALSKHLFTATE